MAPHSQWKTISKTPGSVPWLMRSLQQIRERIEEKWKFYLTGIEIFTSPFSTLTRMKSSRKNRGVAKTLEVFSKMFSVITAKTLIASHQGLLRCSYIKGSIKIIRPKQTKILWEMLKVVIWILCDFSKHWPPSSSVCLQRWSAADASGNG